MQNANNSNITEAIETLIDERAIFSVYDVTKKIRGEGLHVMHADVKAVVYSFTFPFFYDRELVKVNGKDVLVNCPDSKDYNDYDPEAVPEVKVNRTPQLPPVQPATPTKPVAVKGSTMFDRNGRYSVPAKVVRDAGFKPGEKITCKFEVDKIILCKATTAGDKEYTVDTYGNIRIYRSDMTKSFSTVPTAFDVTANEIANLIVLESSED